MLLSGLSSGNAMMVADGLFCLFWLTFFEMYLKEGEDIFNICGRSGILEVRCFLSSWLLPLFFLFHSSSREPCLFSLLLSSLCLSFSLSLLSHFCWLLLLWRSPWIGDPGCQRSLLCSGPEQPLGPLGCLSDSWLMAATVWPSRRGGLSYQAQPGMWDRLCCEGEPGLCPRLSLQVHWFCSCLPTWCSSTLGVFMVFGTATAERMLRL